MTDLLSDFWVHDISVERLTGSGAAGDAYATAATLTGFVDSAARRDAGQRLVDGEGREVDASISVYLPAATADIPVGSRVTLPVTFGAQRRLTVVAAMHRDGGPLDVPEHLEIALR